MPFVSKSEAARQLGFGRTYLNALIGRGIVTEEPGKKIDVAKARSAIAAIRNPAKALGRKVDGEPKNATDIELNQLLTRSRIKESIERSAVAEMERKKREGQLIEVAAMEKVWALASQQVRDGFLALPELLAHELAALTDPVQVRERLRAEFVKILQEYPTKVYDSLAQAA